MLMGAAGVGAFTSAVVLAMRRTLRGLPRWVALATGTFGLSLILFGLSRWFWLSFALMVPVGFSMMLTMSGSNTLIQSMSPDNLRGRVMSVYSMMLMGMAPVGSLLAGILAGHLGAPATVGVGGLTSIIAAAGFALWLPSLRAEARELIVAQQVAHGDPPQELAGGSLAYEIAEEKGAILP